MGTTKGQASFSPHLNEDQIVLMVGDNINLAFGTAVVGLPDTVALLFQEVPGQFFSQYAGIPAFHFLYQILNRSERLAVDGRWSQPAQVRDMLFRTVTFVPGQSVAGIGLVELNHHVVPGYLGDN